MGSAKVFIREEHKQQPTLINAIKYDTKQVITLDSFCNTAMRLVLGFIQDNQ